MITVTPGELATIDDALTDLLLERVFYWAEVRKTSEHYKPLRGISDRHIHDLVRSIAECETGTAANLAVKKALQAFLELKEVKRCRDRLSELAKDEFQRHTVRYLTIYKASCGFEIDVSMRYVRESKRSESCVISRARFKRGDEIVGLSGSLARLSQEEETELANDFSVLHSSRRGGNCLMLGPARFVNHDCSANARFVPVPSGMVIQAVKPISVGDEITVKYAENYFGKRNRECLCQTCQENSRGYYGSPQESSEEVSDDGIDELTKIELRRRKKLKQRKERGSSESRESSQEAVEISTSKNWPLIPRISSVDENQTPLPVEVGDSSQTPLPVEVGVATPLPVEVGDVSKADVNISVSKANDASIAEVSTVVPTEVARPVLESQANSTIDPLLNAASSEIRFPSLPSPDTTTSPESHLPPFIQPKSARRNRLYDMHHSERFHDRLSVLDERAGSEDLDMCLVSDDESRDTMSRDDESSSRDDDGRRQRTRRHVRSQRKNSGSWTFTEEDLAFDRLGKAAREQAYDPAKYALSGVYGFSVSGATQTCVSCCSVYNLTDGPKALGHFCPRCHRHAAIHSFAWPYTNYKHALPLCLLIMRPPKKLEPGDWGLSKPQVTQQFGRKNRKIFEDNGLLVQKKRKSLAWSWEYTKEEPAQEITSMRIEDMSPRELKKWSQAGRQTRSGRVSALPEKSKRSRQSAPEPVQLDDSPRLSREERAAKRARRATEGGKMESVTPTPGPPKVKKLHWKQKLAMERREREAREKEKEAREAEKEAVEVEQPVDQTAVDQTTEPVKEQPEEHVEKPTEEQSEQPTGQTTEQLTEQPAEHVEQVDQVEQQKDGAPSPAPRGRGRPKKTPENERHTPADSPEIKKEPLSWSFSASPKSRSGRVRNPTEKALQLMEQGQYVV
ncbi:Histone-lysine N-methyltransferase SET9 [Yarrowia sp. B02]|nr:Histone-lysine N-methyltransferase SET9 [Yarrowia sp. B02]